MSQRITVAWVILIAIAQAVAGQRLEVQDFFPRTDDEELQAFFADPSVRWYDVTTRPPIFQHNGRLHSIYEDIGPGGPRFSNGNGEWPWAHPSVPTNDGRTRNIIGVKLAGYHEHPVDFAQQELSTTFYSSGPVVRRDLRGFVRGLGWTMHEGTDIVELVTNRIGRGDYTFKVHRMTMQGGEWVFRVYRPFTSGSDYQEATGTKAVFAGNVRVRSSHMVAAFDERRDVWKVPRIDPELARRLLLTTSFKLATDDEFIPTTDHTDQIYPKGYLGAFIGNATNQENCRRCHQDVATNVRKFDTGEWYGQIRGGAKDKHGAGVFTWYPDRLLPRR